MTKTSTRKKPAKRGGIRKTKKDAVLALLRRKNGACLDDLTNATGWQAHSVRGFLSGTVRKTLGFNLVAEKRTGGGQRYYIRGAK